MIPAHRMVAIATCLLSIAACQSYQPAAQPVARNTAVDGKWSSADGVFVATFRGGSFTSVDARTSAILAEGNYNTDGTTVNMNWRSKATSQQHSAVCTMAGPNSIHCSQENATGFDLMRSA